jgi:hypothetical protein
VVTLEPTIFMNMFFNCGKGYIMKNLSSQPFLWVWFSGIRKFTWFCCHHYYPSTAETPDTLNNSLPPPLCLTPTFYFLPLPLSHPTS